MAETRNDAVARALFGDAALTTFALVDGASVENLPRELWRHSPQYECLYRGELQPDVAAVAPYVVEIREEHAFTEWLLTRGWGNHYATFLTAPAGVTLAVLRRHFRRFTLARTPENRAVYFRFYDPRVLSAFLPTCDRAQLRDFFGPVTTFIMESEESGLIRMSLSNGRLVTQTHGARAAGRVA